MSYAGPMPARRTSALVVSFAFALTACGGSGAPASDARSDDAVTVASFNFPESVLLAEIYAQAMERAGFRIEREVALGPRELVMPALVSGLVEFVPEYSGSGLQFLAGPGSTSSDPETNHRIFADRLASLDVTALDASPAEDQNGFVVTSETAERYDLRTLSDLATVSDRLVFGGPPECAARPFCLPGLDSTYGIGFADTFTNLDAGGPRTVSALAQGTVDVALLFTSDGAIDLNDFVLLDDDRRLQPAENVTPVIRADALARFGPSLAEKVNAVSALLSTDELRMLNAEVARGADPVRIASAWLASSGFGAGAGVESPSGMDATGGTRGVEQRGRTRVDDHAGQRRRPSGEPPALPHELGRSGKFLLLMLLYFVLVLTGFLVFPSLEGVFERLDHGRQVRITDLRSPGLTRVMLAVNGLASSWTIRLLRWGVIIGLVVFRRWRHLLVFLGAIILTEIVAYNASTRHRPAPTARHRDPHGMAGVLDAVAAARGPRRLGRRSHLRPDRGRAPAVDREMGDRDRPRDPRVRSRVPGGGPHHRCRDGWRVRHRRGGRDVPMVRAQRPVPRVVPAREGRPPGHRGPAR